MLCPDEPEELELYGVIEDDEYQFLQIQITRCTNSSYCKTNQEINNFIDKQNLSIVYTYNNMKYLPEHYDDGYI